jgi:hypothetical protein
MRRDSLVDERVLDEAIDRYVAWREECDVVRDAYERWTQASGDDAAWAFAEYQAALDREGHISEVYCDLMARVEITLTGERGLVWYAVAWVVALAASAFLTAVILSMVVGTGRI